jgi:hypothetical protein
MKSSSLKMLDAGIANPREYRDMLVHDWFIREDYIKFLDIYLLRETTPAKLFFHMKDGELKVGGKYYSITWLNSPAKIRESGVVLVSLRYCRFLERGYALVKILQGDSEFPTLEY